jgi:hypothetical protein
MWGSINKQMLQQMEIAVLIISSDYLRRYDDDITQQNENDEGEITNKIF